MSSYLVAFIVSEFVCIKGNYSDLTPTNLCTRNGTEEEVTVALEVAPKVLEVMADYTGYPYEHSGMKKMTQVAVPDFAAGAMENWGIVTYRYLTIFSQRTLVKITILTET